MTTTTHSHKAWTDKGGHVNSIEFRLVSLFSLIRYHFTIKKIGKQFSFFV